MHFIHANRGTLRRSATAVLVQVVDYDDALAEVTVRPINFVWIERSWMVRASNRLNEDHIPGNVAYAQVLKMGRIASNAIQQLQQQRPDSTDDDTLSSSSSASSSSASSSSSSSSSLG
jgi:hypothetical protein